MPAIDLSATPYYSMAISLPSRLFSQLPSIQCQSCTAKKLLEKLLDLGKSVTSGSGFPYAYFTSRWRPLSVWIFPCQALVWNQGLPDSCGEIPCRVFQRAMTSLVGTTGSIGTNSDYLEHYCTTEGRLPRISFSDSFSRFPIYLNHPKSQPTARPWRCREIALVRAGDAV